MNKLIRIMILLAFAMFLGGCSTRISSDNPDGDESDGDESFCPVGSETCHCSEDGWCDLGLQCLSGLCVEDPDYVDGDGLSDGDEHETDGEDGPVQDAMLDAFFSLDGIHQIEIRVDESGVDDLLDEPKIYTHAQVSIDDVNYPDVGLRLKGAAGSFVPLDGEYPEISGDGNGRPGKSAFIIDFNRYIRGTDHLGLKKLTLNNIVQDPSSIRQYLGYELFRRGGVAASRSGFALVSFNDELKGLYALIETPDNDCFLNRHFGNDQGNLYEGEYGADLRMETVERMDQDSGADESRQDLYDLAEVLENVKPDVDPIRLLEQYFDLKEYLAFAATELYLGHWDGYAWSANNYAIHHNLEDDLWSFIPWGIDQLFQDRLGRYAGVMKERELAWDQGGRVHQLCMASEQCREGLSQAFYDVLDRVEEMDLDAMAEDAFTLVGDLTLEEAAEFGDTERTLETVEGIGEFISNRGDEIEAWLPCLLGEKVDHDKDGYEGCSVDCEDFENRIHPGAEELCNFIDDDCNELRDEPMHCPKCADVTGPDGLDYALCFETIPWTDARQACMEKGGKLASFHEFELFLHMNFIMMEYLGVELSWIGLNDREVEGEFVWEDGTPVNFTHWGHEAPTEGPEAEDRDCVVGAVWGWWDAPCAAEFGYICKLTADNR